MIPTTEKIQELAEQAQRLATKANFSTEQPYGDMRYDDIFAEFLAQGVIQACIDHLAWHGDMEAAERLEWLRGNKFKTRAKK